MNFFMCIRDVWLRCVKWKAWGYIGPGFGKIMAVVC